MWRRHEQWWLRRSAGDTAKAKSYLPHNKQFLLTRNGVARDGCAPFVRQH